MATYIIGDVQGCYLELQQLLEKIDFNPDHDRLGFVGDLVNRGPDSLAVLQFLRQLKSPLIVLGNHDLYFLILGYELMPLDSYQHSLHQLIQSPHCSDHLEWLRHQPFICYQQNFQATLVHAGIPPQWNLPQATTMAHELETVLQGPNFLTYLKTLFGDQPACWNNELNGQARLRYITNAFTRMRFCTQQGELDFSAQRPTDLTNTQFKAWYEWRGHDGKEAILFGHWAYLNGQCPKAHCYALDTGCAWGNHLTAIRLEDKQRFQVRKA